MIERIETGSRLSKVVKFGGVAYLSGQVGDGETVAEQTADCLARIDDLLRKAGSSKAHILQATVWLADMADFPEMNKIWEEWIPVGEAPARASGEVKMARPQFKVEIVVIAAVI